MTDEKNSNSKRPNNKKPNRRRRRKPARNKSGDNKPQVQAKDNSNKPSPKKNSNNKNKRRRNNNRNRSNNNKKPLKDDEIILKYDNLMEQHLNARKKYFENYHRKDKRRVEKLERNFHKTALDVRAFERRLKPHQFEILEKKIDGYSLDLDYSQSSGELAVTELPVAPFGDPHENQTQQARTSYKDDTEESVGTMDDYEKYRAEKSA